MLAERPRLGDAPFEFVGVNVIGEAQRHQMLPLLGPVEAVDDQDVVETAPVEGPNNGAADKASAARNDDSAAA